MKKVMLLLTITALLAAAAVIAGPAAARGGGVRVVGKCTGSSTIKLKLSKEDTGIQVQLELETQPASKWAITLQDNGSTFFQRTKMARANGVIHVRRLIPDQTGSDTVSGSAANKASGETCSVSATI
jgi:hypothetical protein